MKEAAREGSTPYLGALALDGEQSEIFQQLVTMRSYKSCWDLLFRARCLQSPVIGGCRITPDITTRHSKDRTMKIETLHIRRHNGPSDASGHPYISVNILYEPGDTDARSKTISRLLASLINDFTPERLDTQAKIITASDSSAGTWAEYSYTTEPAH